MDLLGVFARYWLPGRVKTRLAATIGDVAAADVHRCMLRAVLARMATVGDRRVLAVRPGRFLQAFRDVAGPAWQVTAQSDGSLGDRMKGLFAGALQGGAKRVVLLGSDSPTLPVEYVRQAFRVLEEHPVVLGPAEDGGYYLVGASGEVPTIFDRIDWGTGNVMAQTVSQLEAAGCSFATLAPWYDVDRIGDLKRLRDELAHLRSGDANFALLLATVERALIDETGN